MNKKPNGTNLNPIELKSFDKIETILLSSINS